MLTNRAIRSLNGRDLDLAVVVHVLGFRYYLVPGSFGELVSVWPPPRLPGWDRYMWPSDRVRKLLGPTPRGLEVVPDWYKVSAPRSERRDAPTCVPRYHDSLDAAIKLAEHPWVTLTLDQADLGWLAVAHTTHGRAENLASSPAAAISRAVLMAVMAERLRRLTRTIARGK